MLSKRGSILRCTPLFSGPFHDVKEKRMRERHQQEIQKAGHSTLPSEGCSHLNDVSGPSNTVNVDNDRNVQAKERMLALLKEQGQRRIARREAFLHWQAGQREKGAAHRLMRQAKTQEKYKRYHYHTQSGRLISVALAREDGTSSNSDCTFVYPATPVKEEGWDSADFLVPGNTRANRCTIRLTLPKR
ncbi:excreted/secreted protein 23 [Trypanosoma grayi]|uniref:excreted/secreted protein 23 n=1 Tax=Trypanosoma grayi TaxID=71804 RepID=UPI0004F41439|nr:excreted/secreted protein 23 [Trypanosoma grayi]KEG11196.1 excreted/secreted protein 23 [Trypanosoma grayi]